MVSESEKIEKARRILHASPTMLKALRDVLRIKNSGNVPLVKHGACRVDTAMGMRTANSLLLRELVEIKVVPGSASLELEVELTVLGGLLALE